MAFLLMPVMAWGAGPDGVTASALPGEDYKPGTALVAGIELSGGEGGVIAVDSNGSVGINATVTIQNINEAQARSVWLAFEFSIPKVGTSYTNGFNSSWSFAEGSYSWLMDLADPTKVATPVEENGSIVLRGMVLTENSSGGNVLNSTYTRTVQVKNSGSKDGEKVEVDARAWIASDGEEGAKSAPPATVQVSANAEYSAWNSLDGPQISGYYNPKTGEFSTVKPSPDEGYVYGRVYTSRVSISRKNTATEWIDPAETVETTVSFKLEATDEDKVPVEIPDEMQPIVIGAKRCDKNLAPPVNQLEGALLQDLSFGGLIGNPYDAWNKGDYTFRVDEGNPAAVTASSVNRGGQVPTLGDDSLPHFVAFVFVPLDRSGESTIKELTLTSTVANTIVQTVGGTSANVTCPDIPKAVVPLAPKEDDDVVAMFSRWTNAYELPNTAEAGGTKTITNAVTGGGNVVDYQVRAVNQLIKFSSGLEPTRVYRHGKLSFNYRNIPGSGEEATQTFLWAVKPDGTPWKDAKEMSETRANGLLYYDYDKLDDAKRAGTVVGVLVEYRGGMWQSGGMLAGVAIDFEATGEPGTVGSCVQDVYMWMSGKDTDVSYAGLNGAALTQEAKDWNGQMFPTEANKEGYYRPGEWPEGSREPQELDSNTYGDTIYIMAGTVGIDKDASQVLNGTDINQHGKHGAYNEDWPLSAFDFGQDQRYVDRVLTIKVTGAANMPVRISVDLDVTKNSVFSPHGDVLLNTGEKVTYTPGENATSPGTFEGGQPLDKDDLQNLELPGPGTYKLYYSSLIGDPTDLSKDITEAGDYYSHVKIELLDTSVRDFMLGRSYQCYYSRVSLMSASGLDKRAASPVAGDTFTWTLSYTAATQDAQDVFVLDVLPFAQDGRGTTFTGSYQIKDGEVPISYTTASGSDAAGRLRLFYTTAEGIRTGKLPTADIFKDMGESELKDGFTVGNTTWKEAKLNSKGDAYVVGTGEKLTAVMLCGDVNEGERATAKLSFDARSLEGGAVLVNSATYRNATSRQASETGDVKITKRLVYGVGDHLDLDKVFEGKDLASGEFRFTLTNVTAAMGSDTDPTGMTFHEYSATGMGAPVLNGGTPAMSVTVENGNNGGEVGGFDFGAITFTKSGTYYVKVNEVIPPDEDKEAGVVYDDHALYVRYEVTSDGSGLHFVAEKNRTIVDENGSPVDPDKQDALLTWTNRYVAVSALPLTGGDATARVLLVAGSGVLLVAGAAWLLSRRRRV
ncbi:FctA domain-containing protein [Bifidobacterium pullorum]|uniref:Spy0128 family protein n=1 Tax=Bifidobacterium pullorum TaxID=78448 RepID=UPI0025A4898D|nr:FctA domain-containing protein [Bifidobacterium pullorum]MDM8322755.1 FctA domain-containing protein [Bifidobacterium pullorum]